MSQTNPEIFDISPEISENIAVWPGDSPFSREILADFDSGKNYRLSTLRTTVHLGAHADAPNHYSKRGQGIGEQSLVPYLGTCQVIEVSLPLGSRIQIQDIQEHSITEERILFKTNSFSDPNRWNSDFVALSPELIEYLSKKNVILVGIDTPSVDLFEDTQLQTHQILEKENVRVLEGLVLDSVKPGVYELIALPLRIQGADASPVRAILRKV